MLPQIYQLKEFKEGYLAIMGRPRGWDWLEDEIAGLRQLGIGLVVSLLEADEESELGLIKEREICEKQGIQFISFPIKDRGVPSSLEDTAQLTDYLRKQLATGKKVVVHCRAGIGRSALMAACIFIQTNELPETSFGFIAKDRHVQVPDTEEQKQWVITFYKAKSNTKTTN